MDEYSSTPTLVFLKKFGLVLLLGIAGLVSLLYGLMQYFPHSDNPNVSFDSPQLGSTPVVEHTLMVDISGAIQNPGVYAFSADARVVDAITKAGGLTAKADRALIEKTMNQAMKLTDGMKIYIPKVGENVKVVQVANGTEGTSETNVLGVQTGRISINSATASELDALPGVGSVTAGKIISGRPYSSIEELLSKKVVSSSVFNKIKDQISL